MAVVDGVSGFTQLTKLNVTESLMVGGTPAGSIKTLLAAASFSSQTPTGLDSDTQVTFGGAQVGPTGLIQLAEDGSVTFLRDFKNIISVISLSLTRTGASGVSNIFYRVLLNGELFGAPLYKELDTDTAQEASVVTFLEGVSEGDIITVEFLRDSGNSGDNSGQLEPATPASSGWIASPSASITIQTFT